MRVLYVEDEKFLADAVKFNLEKQGISVDIAPDGEEGLMFLAMVKDITNQDQLLFVINGVCNDIFSDKRNPYLFPTACNY